MRDGELLFGVMTVQLGFASAQQVMACAGEWAMRQDASLGAILEDRQLLKPEQRRMVEGLCEKALQLNGGDVARTMQSLPQHSQSVLQSLTRSVISGKHEDPEDVTNTQKTRSHPQVDSLDGTENVCEEIPGRYALNTGSAGGAEELGRGGIGRVVVAYDQFLGREVALKELLAEHLSNPAAGTAQSMQLEARFLREARLTGQLEHPTIVPVYEVGRRKDGSLYYTMQRVRGLTLYEAQKASRGLSKRLELLPHFLRVCQAIAYAHSRGVVHRDVKPQNVMIGPFGETFLLDWGLARAKGKSDPRAKELKLAPDITGNVLEGGAIGTPSYMSPEQAEGKVDEIDERSDVWCLGAVLYELLTGRPPYEGVNPFAVLGKILKEAPAPVRSLEPGVPAELAAVTEKCLQRDKQLRYATAAQLAHDVESWLNGGRVTAHEYGSVELVRRFVRRNRVPVLVATSAAVLLAVMAGQSYVRVHQERDQARQFAQLFLDDVSDKLAPLPDSRELVEELTTRTLDYYRKTVDPLHGPRDERLRLATAWQKIGRLAVKVGKGDDADRAFAFALQVARGLVSERPADPQSLALVAEALVGQADVANDKGKNSEAEELFLEALPRAERAAALMPLDTEMLKTHARVLSRLGQAALEAARRPEALNYFERTMKNTERIFELKPEDEAAADALLISCSSLGSVQEEQGDHEAARITYLRMLGVGKKMYERNPAHGEAVFAYANGLLVLGSLDRAEGRQTEAMPQLKHAAELLQVVRDHDPEAVEPLAFQIQAEIELGHFDKADQLTTILRGKGLAGDYNRTYVASAFLAGKLGDALRDAAAATGIAELNALIYGALASALSGDRAGAIDRAERARTLAGRQTFEWHSFFVAEQAAKTDTPEGAAAQQLAKDLDVSMRKGDPQLTEAALGRFVVRLKALPPQLAPPR